MIMDPMGSGMGMVTMVVVGLAVLVAIVVGIVYVVRLVSRRDQRVAYRPRAIDILEERFARGDIDPDEYESRRELLRQAR